MLLSGFCFTSGTTCSDQPLIERNNPICLLPTARFDHIARQVHERLPVVPASGIQQCNANPQARMRRRVARHPNCVETSGRPRSHGLRTADAVHLAGDSLVLEARHGWRGGQTALSALSFRSMPSRSFCCRSERSRTARSSSAFSRASASANAPLSSRAFCTTARALYSSCARS